MQLNDKQKQDLLKALQSLSDEHGLGMDAAPLAAAEQPHPQDASFYLQTLFPHRTASHAEELGEAPGGAYPRLLAAYAQASGGAFDPQSIEADSDDGWDSLTLEFRHAGRKQRFKVGDVEDSDWFAPAFVKALNRFAKRAGLPGRWVDFHNGDDACTSIYVPEAAQARFKALKKKYSARTEEDGGGWTPELLARAKTMSINFPPALEVRLDKEPLAQRTAAWPEYGARRRVNHSKSEVKLFERYYLHGTEPKSDDLWGEDPIPLIYRLWLFPDQSDAAWCAITERVLSYEQGVGRSLMDSVQILRRAYSRDWNGQDWPSGAFGGAEQRLLHFLQGRMPCSAHFSYKDKPLYPRGPLRPGPNTMDALRRWLNDEPPYNPYDLARYQGEELLAGFTDTWVQEMAKECKLNCRIEPILIDFLAAIANHPAPRQGVEADERQAFCLLIRQGLDVRTLPAPFADWWAKAKN